MFPITKPYLKKLNEKLYVSRKPRIMSWLLFVLTIIVCTTLFRCLTNGIFVLTIFILGEILFGLDTFGEWEELMLDKTENLATFTKYSWCDKLFSKSPENYSLRIKDIRHIGVSQNMGLFMLPRNGKAMTFSTKGLRHDEVQNMKRDINFFLNPNRVEYIGRNSADLGDHLLNASDSDEYLQSLLGKYSRQEVPFSTSMINGRKANADSSIHQHQSSPLLGAYNRAERSHEKFLKKRPYNTNDFLQTIPPL